MVTTTITYVFEKKDIYEVLVKIKPALNFVMNSQINSVFVYFYKLCRGDFDKQVFHF